MCSGESLCHALLDFLRTSIQFYLTKITDSVQETGIICSCLESYFMLDIVCYEAKIEESDQLTVAQKGTWNWGICTTCAVHEKDGKSWGSSNCHGSYFSPTTPLKGWAGWCIVTRPFLVLVRERDSTSHCTTTTTIPTDMCSGKSLCHALLDFLRTSIQFYPTKIIDSVQKTQV